MKKLINICIIASSINIYASSDLKEVISSDDAPLVNKTYYKLKRKWYSAKSGFTASVGSWYINWDQTSTSDKMLKNQNDSLDVNYDISASVAAVLTLKANYKLLSAKVEYYSTGMTAKKDEKISGLNANLSIVDIIPYMDTEFRLSSANFEGSIQSNSSNGTFKTQVNKFDLIVYPFNKYLGFGYRKYSYDFPQDLYLVKNSDDSILTKGLANVKYDGNFYTVALDNKRLKERGFMYSALAGVGKLTPSAVGYDQYLEKSDAKFADLFLGYGITTKKRGLRLSFIAGYSYNKIETKAQIKDSQDYTLMTQFNTEFHGPFAQVAIIY